MTANFIGLFIVTPAVLAWFVEQQQRRLHPRQVVEFALILLSLIVISQIAFWGGYPVEYMMILPLLWLAFRFGARESTLLVVIMSAIAVYGTAHDFGSFARKSITESLVLLQSFIGAIALTTFVLSAIVNENRKAAANLQKANDELEQRVQQRTTELIAAKLLADSANQAKSGWRTRSVSQTSLSKSWRSTLQDAARWRKPLPEIAVRFFIYIFHDSFRIAI